MKTSKWWMLGEMLAVAILVFAMFPALVQGGNKWVEYGDNPIFGEGAGGAKAYYPSVLYDTDGFSGHGGSAKYKMWYGTSGSQTSLATSNDGIVWTDQGVVMTDGYHATVEYFPTGFAGVNSGDDPNDSTMNYRMWYWDPSHIYEVAAIGYTESPDGVNWYNDQPCQNGAVPIVTGVNPNWNRGSYGPCDVLYNPDASNTGTDWSYTMYYDGTTGGTESIGLGFSSDGITWTGFDPDGDSKANQVLSGTYVAGNWDYNYVSRATIIQKADGGYEIWYSGGDGTMNQGIGYALSPDGKYWVRDDDNPLLYKDDGVPWRRERTYCPMVVFDPVEGIYKMWFAGKDASGNYSIGYAVGGPQPTVVWVDDDWASAKPAVAVIPGRYFGYNAFATVEDGVAGVAGSTVNVAPGTYTPAAKITIDKVGLLLIGPQAGVDPRPSTGTSRVAGDTSTEAVIDGSGTLSRILYINADDVVIEGLEVCNGTGDLITSPSGTTQYRPIIRYNIVHDSSGDEGIQLKKVVDALIEYNHVYNTGGDGINIGYGSTRGTIQYNEVHDIYSPDAAIYVYGTPNVVIRGNLVYDVHNNDGIKLGSKNGADAGLSGGLISGNTVHDTAQDGITVYMSNVNVEGNEVYNSGSENGAIYLAWPITNIALTRNVVRDNSLDPGKWGNPAGILIGTAVDAANVTIHYNSITGNTPFGVSNLTGTDVDATLNWWGDGEGPTHTSNTNTTTGDAVSDYVIYSPWLGIYPDGNPTAPGVQITGPMLIIVAPVGPEPTGGYLNTAIAGANSADLPYADTIQVRSGTYADDATITDPVTIGSQEGCPSTTFIDGNLVLGSEGIQLGSLRHGFTIRGDLTVGAGTNAAQIHVNWNNIEGQVTNTAGIGSLDATYNFWGADGPLDNIVGQVHYYPYLPVEVCMVIQYMDDYGLNPNQAIVMAKKVLKHVNPKDVLAALGLVNICGMPLDDAFSLLREYGRVKINRAIRLSRGDCAKLYSLLIGYRIECVALDDSYIQGDTIRIAFTLTDPISEETVPNAAATLSVVRITSGEIMDLVYFDVIPYDSANGQYQLNYDTSGLAPGYYDLYIGTSHGEILEFHIEILAP